MGRKATLIVAAAVSCGYRCFFWPADDNTDSTSGTYYADLGLLFIF